jgi:hypothetical protein
MLRGGSSEGGQCSASLSSRKGHQDGSTAAAAAAVAAAAAAVEGRGGKSDRDGVSRSGVVREGRGESRGDDTAGKGSVGGPERRVLERKPSLASRLLRSLSLGSKGRKKQKDEVHVGRGGEGVQVGVARGGGGVQGGSDVQEAGVGGGGSGVGGLQGVIGGWGEKISSADEAGQTREEQQEEEEEDEEEEEEEHLVCGGE